MAWIPATNGLAFGINIGVSSLAALICAILSEIVADVSGANVEEMTGFLQKWMLPSIDCDLLVKGEPDVAGPGVDLRFRV